MSVSIERLLRWSSNGVLPLVGGAVRIAILVLVCAACCLPFHRADDVASPLHVSTHKYLFSSPSSFSTPSWNASACNTTFADLDTASIIPLFNYRTVAFYCPPLCLNFSSPSSSSAPLVYGSYPYSANSSICLSAVHCGVINNTLGGSVFPSRFYRHDWSNTTANQTTFPFTSAIGTTSNNVTSLDVSASQPAAPSNGSQWSYVVRGRGEFVQQRRLAPFSPRSGHSHVGFTPFSSGVLQDQPAPLYYSVHIIAGGYDGAHYLNDVWVAEPSNWTDPNSDVQWRQLPNAPFTPRADMQTGLVQESSDGCGLPGAVCSVYSVFFYGGQTDHACGLYELGVCSDEVWQLQLNVTVGYAPSQPFLVTSYAWTTSVNEPVARFPFTARCGASVLFLTRAAIQPTIVVGGQLSYNDSTCQAAPTAVSEVWTSNDHTDYSSWQQDADAPFAPRRSQQREDALAVTQQSRLTFPLDVYPLLGGLTVLNLTTVGNVTQLGGVQVWADVWICYAQFVPAAAPFVSCSWGWQQQQVATWYRQPYNLSVPTTSVPLPVALAPSAAVRTVPVLAGQHFGGFTAQQAIDDWTNSPQPFGATSQLTGAFNWTFMRRAYPASDSDQSYSLIAQQRFDTPLSYNLSADQLNSPASPYQAGSEWVHSVSAWQAKAFRSDIDVTFPSVSTIHPQRYSMAVGAADASVFVWQAASSVNTSRGLFRVGLPRLGGGFDEWSNLVFSATTYAFVYTVGQRIVSGGRTSGTPLNDWITMGEVRCLPPDDPSYLTLLGPVRIVQSDAVRGGPDSSYAVRDSVMVDCVSRYHFEPPLVLLSLAEFQCGPNGVWLDADLPTIRHCVANAPLNCTAPLNDTGELYCQPPVPTVSSINASLVRASDAVTLSNFPVTADTVLSVRGSYFPSKLIVTVGGLKCANALLTGKPFELCYNISCAADSGGPAGVYRRECDFFSDSFSCSVPATLGLHLPVQVVAGPAAVTALLQPSDGAQTQAATISSTFPVITFMAAYTTSRDDEDWVCNATQPFLQLYNCPVMTAYNLTLCLDLQSVGQLPLVVTLGASLVGLPCVDEDISSIRPSWTGDRCLTCVVAPFLGTQAVRVQHTDLALQSRTDASLSSSSCPPGFQTNYDAALNSSFAGDLCQACPVGTSTRGAIHSRTCVACAIGTYASHTGIGDCLPCAPGRYYNSTGATQCSLCPLNQYQPTPGAGSCNVCDQGRFVLYTGNSSALDRAYGQCTACPDRAVCRPSGAIYSTAGAFLVINQDSAAVEAVSCSSTACLQAPLEPIDAEHAWVIERSGLQVVNDCAPGRYPGYTEHWRATSALQPTEGVNVLCALCLPGYTQVNGHCIECASTQWGPLFLLLLVTLSLVYLVHRLPHDWSGGATMTITAYFLQQCDLFLSYDHFSVFNMDVLGLQHRSLQQGHVQDWCVVPLTTDGQRFLGSLMSVPIAFAMLLPIALLHVSVRQLLVRALHRLPGAKTCLSLYSIVFFASVPNRGWGPGVMSKSASNLLVPLHAGAEEAEAAQFVESKVEETSEGEERGERAAYETAPPPVSCLHRLQRFVHRWGAHTAASAPPVWLLYQRSTVRMMQLSYTALALISIRFFHYQDVKQYGHRLVDYPAMAVTSTTYKLLAPFVIVVLTIVCCIPVVLLVFLWRQYRSGVMKELKAAESSDSQAPVAVPSPDAALTLQLCCMFKPHCWWMSAFIPLRRLVLVAVFVASREEQRWVYLTLLNQLLLVTHLSLQPYKRPRDNHLESLNLLSLCTQTTLLCLGYASAVPGGLEALVVCPLVALVAVSVLLPAWRMIQQRRRARAVREKNEAELVGVMQ